jgi:hypothetical protein
MASRHGYVRAPLGAADLHANTTQRHEPSRETLAAFACTTRVLRLAAMHVLHVDLEMLVNVGGMERADAEYRSLFENAGFRLTSIVPLMDAAGFSVFEGVCT